MNTAPAACSERIRVRGTVQGVGFRPTVWRIAQALGLRGHVANDAEGVLIEAWGEADQLHEFVARIEREAPPLARIAGIERSAGSAQGRPLDFRILGSADAQAMRTEVPADAATCPACLAEILDPFARRYRYPFTNCTHCGPRLSIIGQMPYNRADTTMAAFPLCAACAAEYGDPADRRFHAQPIACHACGPKATLERGDGRAMAMDSLSILDAVDAACTLLQRGQLLAIQGLGGYQLACDATQPEAVAQLRAGKRRERKPFALMARDLDVVRRYCLVSAAEEALLQSAAAPIVLLTRKAPPPPCREAVPGQENKSIRGRITQSANGGGQSPPLHSSEPAQASIAADVAPGMATLGFMLPNTPLHHLLLKRMTRPIVLTSGNLADEPQAIGRADARTRLAPIAEYFLEHNRPIARRVDDSVARVLAGEPHLLRRARGYAPAALPLPPGFEQAPRVLAYGGELKNTFCLLRDGEAIVSPHIGDLQEPGCRADYRSAMADFQRFFAFTPQLLACDLHPDYSSSQIAQAQAEASGLPLRRVQHHHAHIAACMAENRVALDTPPVLGVALDGLGYGADGRLWGGEFLRCDYRHAERLGSFKQVALLGGEAAVREPWRNTYAHLMAQMGWANFAMNYADLDLYKFLAAQPRELLDGMLKRGVNAPLASSCGRLFDAVAAALGLAREHAAYEGQGAVELEAAVDRTALETEDEQLAYPLNIPRLAGMPYIEPLAMWSALLGDLVLNTPVGVIAARFHRGLAKVIVRMVEKLTAQYGSEDAPLMTVALSGGVFQNRILFELVLASLQSRGYTVLTHRQLPCNDGGLAYGQAVIAAARQLSEPNTH